MNKLVSWLWFCFFLKNSEGNLWSGYNYCSKKYGCFVKIHTDKTIIKNKFYFIFQDEAILETTDYITEFTSKFKKLESALRAAKTEEFSLNKEKQDLKLRLKELILETNKLKGKCFYRAPNLV